MATAKLYNGVGKENGTVDLPSSIFEQPVHKQALYEAVKNYRANQRQGTHDTLTRAEVRYSTAKLYRQKGTGRARHGSIRAPIFVGGGRAHPAKPQDWSYRPPRRVRASALRGALSLLVKEGRCTIVDKIELGEIKTKRLAGVLTDLNASNKSLLVDDAANQELRLSVRNMKDSNFLPPEGVNVYDLLRHEHLVVSQEAIKAIEARLLGGKSEVES